MTRKKLSILKRMACFTLILVLCFSMAPPTFAELNSNGALLGTEANPPKAAITKMLKLPVGTTTPAFSFEFEITQTGGITVPGLVNQTLSFGASSDKTMSPVDGVNSVYQETPDIFAGVTWPAGGGEYEFRVKETHDNNPLIDDAFYKEELIYSPAVYDVTVYTKEKENSTTESYIFAIVTMVDTRDTDDGAGAGAKIDPSPGSVQGEYSGMIFTNEYSKKYNGTDPDNDTTFKLSKTVHGPDANPNEYFSFAVYITQPSVGVTAPTTEYYAYLMDETDTAMSFIPTENFTVGTIVGGTVGGGTLSTSSPQFITFNSGDTIFVNLKHGQWFNFVGTHVGARFLVIESGKLGYTPTCEITAYNRTSLISDTTANNDLSTGPQYLGDSDIMTQNNKAAFMNTKAAGTIPTGISVDDLPYVILIGTGLISLAGYVFFKSRKKAKII
ncbi:MAG: hypothetical protein FWH55_12165 [Oscillospiraceae bacterium]|nr:hypothetical protein [Oscillospiraceae bacterium]